MINGFKLVHAKMNKPKFIQIDCKEEQGLDLRQAQGITKYKPDIVILEYPNNKKTPDWVFNKYSALHKPQELVKERLKEFPPDVLKIHPRAKSDTFMWKNIVNLWNQGHQVLVYSADAPSKLTREWLHVRNHTYPCVKKNWLWWVQIYLRERFMANHVEWILKKNKHIKNPIIMVYLENFHWKHVKFLMSKPSKDKIRDYYFGKFYEIDKKSIGQLIKENNKVFYKFWLEYSDLK